MSTAYLNGDYLPLEQAKISPLDRGFLFGDGAYEIIPYYQGRAVGLIAHIERLLDGLGALSIDCELGRKDWYDLVDDLVVRNKGSETNLAVYVHVSRGADSGRFHAYPKDISPTIFCFAFVIKDPEPCDRHKALGYRVISHEDLRWHRCHIKSTALLGNVMHFQQAHAGGDDECLLFNKAGELSEGSASNVYVVKSGVVITPPPSNQILSGITRRIVLDALRKDGSVRVEERAVSMDEVRRADEVWLSSSSKELVGVTHIDGQAVGDGKVGVLWERAFALYTSAKFSHR